VRIIFLQNIAPNIECALFTVYREKVFKGKNRDGHYTVYL